MKFSIMDTTGHSTVEFTDEQKAEADAKFRALIGEGKTAATRKAGETDYKVIKDPAKIEDETLFVPQLRGG